MGRVGNVFSSINKILGITECDKKDCKFRACNCCKKCVNNKTLGISNYYVQHSNPKKERVKYNED